MKVRITYDANGNIERAFIVHTGPNAVAIDAVSPTAGLSAALPTLDVDLEAEPHQLHDVLRNYRVDPIRCHLIKADRAK